MRNLDTSVTREEENGNKKLRNKIYLEEKRKNSLAMIKLSNAKREVGEIIFFLIGKRSIVLKKVYTMYTYTKTKRGENAQKTIALYGELNQFTKSIKEATLSPMYTLTQSQKMYKKELLIV